jgi:SSS family solute:Na+ symporter
VIPIQVGGYGHVFAAAAKAFEGKAGAGLTLHPDQMLPFATLALGSALAGFMYPHTMTGVLSSSSANTIRKNAMLLPAYTVMLGLIALLGYMAIAAGLTLDKPTNVVPALFNKIFPDWFVGFSFAAIAIGALVPAAIMSIGAANLWTRNIWKPFVNPGISEKGESDLAKISSLLVKVGALSFILFLPTQYAIDLQLIGGIWILQIFPAIVFGLFRARLHPVGLTLGWFVGLVLGTWLSISVGVKPIVPIHLFGATYTVYIGLIALAVNLIISFTCSSVLPELATLPNGSKSKSLGAT